MANMVSSYQNSTCTQAPQSASSFCASCMTREKRISVVIWDTVLAVSLLIFHIFIRIPVVRLSALIAMIIVVMKKYQSTPCEFKVRFSECT